MYMGEKLGISRRRYWDDGRTHFKMQGEKSDMWSFLDVRWRGSRLRFFGRLKACCQWVSSSRENTLFYDLKIITTIYYKIFKQFILVCWRMSRKSSISSYADSNDDLKSLNRSEGSVMSLSESLHIEELLSKVNYDDGGNVFHQDLLDVLNTRWYKT